MQSKVQIVSNSNYPIGKIINQELQNSLETQIAVAFLKRSGIKTIEDSLKMSLDKGGKFELIVGLDFKTTDPLAMKFFIDLHKQYKDVHFYCYGDKGQNKNDIVFHPKIYLFRNLKETVSIVGSTNLTEGGLMSNFEVNTVFNEKQPIYYSQLQAIYNDLNNLTIIPYISTSYPNLPNYKQHLEELIDNNVGDLSIVSTCYKLLKEIVQVNIIDKQLTAPQIYTLFNNCDDTNDFRYDLIAMRLAQYTNIPITSNTNKIVSCINRTDAEIVEKVAAVIEYYTSYNDILIKSSQLSNQVLFKEIAIILTKESHRNSRLNLQQALNHYDTIKQYLELDADIIITRFNNWRTTEITANTITSIPLLFFKDIAENNIKNELADHCIAQYTSYLNTISTENWKDHIEAKDTEYEMLQYIGKNKIQGCFDAFSILLVDKTTESNNILSVDKRDYLLNLAKTKGYKLTRIFNSVRDKYCSGTATMTAEHFQYFGELLLQYATLNNQSVLCNIFPNNLFDYDNNVAIIIKYKDIMLSVYNLAGDGEKEDFQRKLQTLIDGKYKDEDNAPQGFEDFAGAFGVSKKIADSITEKLTK